MSAHKSRNDKFSAEPDFCSDCGAIMPLPRDEPFVVCRVCRKEVNVKVYHGLTSHSEIIFNKPGKHLSTTPSENADGPVVDRTCSNCGGEGMSYSTLQTRSADEGQTVFYTCVHCGHKEIENS